MKKKKSIKTIQIDGFLNVLNVNVVDLFFKELGGYSVYKDRHKPKITSYCGEKYYEFDDKKLKKVFFHLNKLRGSIKKLRKIEQFNGG